MTLEDRLDTLTEALNNCTAALLEVIGTAKAGGGDAADDKPKTTRSRSTKTKDDAKDDKADKADESNEVVVSDEFKKKLQAWLAEFAKKEDKDNPDGVHPEVTARRAALKKAFEGLEVANLTEVKGDAVERLETWFGKAVGKGRFAPDPEPEDDDGLGV